MLVSAPEQQVLVGMQALALLSFAGTESMRASLLREGPEQISLAMLPRLLGVLSHQTFSALEGVQESESS